MTISPQQATAALAFIKELGQERINTMGPQMQSIIVPMAQKAFDELSVVISEMATPQTNPE